MVAKFPGGRPHGGSLSSPAGPSSLSAAWPWPHHSTQIAPSKVTRDLHGNKSQLLPPLGSYGRFPSGCWEDTLGPPVFPVRCLYKLCFLPQAHRSPLRNATLQEDVSPDQWFSPYEHLSCPYLSTWLHCNHSFFFFFFPLILFFFLGPHLRHVDVPRLGVESELQLPAYTTATATLDLGSELRL